MHDYDLYDIINMLSIESATRLPLQMKRYGLRRRKMRTINVSLSHNLLLQRIESSPHISRQLRLRALGIMEEPAPPSSTAGMLPLPESPPMLMLS